MKWTVYLSGEIHTDWRDQIKQGATNNGLPLEFTSAVTNHEASDAAGDVLGAEENNFGVTTNPQKSTVYAPKHLSINVISQSYVLVISTNNGMPPSTLAIVRH